MHRVLMEKMSLKRVSVVLCTYNGEKYIREQLESIVSQTYPIHELLIQDDCSTDATPLIIEEYKEKYPFIRFYRNKNNLGFNRNFWKAFEKVTGDYIAISDQDDIWVDTKIEVLVGCIGNYLMVYADSVSFFDKIPYYVAARKEEFVLTGLRFISLQYGVLGHDCLMRKELIQITPKEVREKFVYDFALALVARSKRSLLHKVENLTYFRRHPHASSNLLQNVKGGFRGYLDGFLSLGKRNRLEISDRYRLMLPYLSMEEPLVYQYALYLSSGRILGIFRAGWITYVCRSELRGNTKSIMNKV